LLKASSNIFDGILAASSSTPSLTFLAPPTAFSNTRIDAFAALLADLVVFSAVLIASSNVLTDAITASLAILTDLSVVSLTTCVDSSVTSLVAWLISSALLTAS